jgi:hypothetical protein
VVRGRRLRGRCVRGTGRPRCNRYVRARTLTRRYVARGLKRVRFTGTGLAKARFRLTAVATDSNRRRSVPKRTSFRIRP